jgi:hypothetical protein
LCNNKRYFTTRRLTLVVFRALRFTGFAGFVFAFAFGFGFGFGAVT